MAVELLPHQAEAVEKMHNGCVLRGGVGSGKTPTALAYYWTKVLGATLNDWASVTEPTDLYIFTTARKRDEQDWQTWASRFCLSEDPTLSVCGIRVVVDSYNNMPKYKEAKNAFIIMDEQRMVGAGLWSKTFLLLAKSNQWVMLSATPADKWEDYIPLFVANGFYKNRTHFTRDHLVYSYYGSFPRLERYVGTAKLAKLRESILVEMPFERHTRRHLIEVPVDYDHAAFERVVKDRWNIYEERPLRDVAELFAIMRKVVNSNTSRIEAIRSLMQKHPRLIVFYNFDYELEILRSLVSSPTSLDSGTRNSRSISPEDHGKTSISPASTKANANPISSRKTSSSRTTRSRSSLMESCTTPGDLVVAEWNGHKHEPVPEGDRWVYLVQYTAGAEAWNCTRTDAIAFYSQTYSFKQDEQSQGRIDRLDTAYIDLYYYRLKSTALIDKAIAASLKNKKSFNEKEFVKNGLKSG